ncbi:MAG: BatA domain-containing protein [Spirochaetes bacterium]|nr:BatA domain-containing protein [Spirochaetota bacterium]
MFSAPLYLLLIGFVAVPVIIHFILIRTKKRIRFPSTMLFEIIAKRRGAFSRFRDIILFITRVSIIIIVSLIAAHLFIGRSGHFSGITHWYFFIDNSASSARETENGRIITRLTREADILAKLLYDRNSGISVAVITADGAVKSCSSYRACSDTLAAIKAGDGTFTLRDAFAAAEHVRQPNIRYAAALFTDGQASNTLRAVKADYPAVLFTVPFTRQANAGILDVQAPHKIVFLNEVVPVTVTVNRERFDRAGSIKLFTGASLAATGEVPPGDGPVTIALALNVRSKGLLPITVTLDTDAYTADNTRYLALPVIDRIVNALIDDDRETPSAREYYLNASTAAARAGSIAVKTYPSVTAVRERPDVITVVSRTLTDADMQSLASRAAAGVHIMFFPRETTDPRTFAAQLNRYRLMPMRSLSLETAARTLRSSDTSLAALADGIRTARYFSISGLDADAFNDMPLVFDNGAPAFILRRNANGQTTGLCAITPSADNQFFFTPLFVVLMNRTLYAMAGGSDSVKTAAAGEPVSAVFAAEGSLTHYTNDRARAWLFPMMYERGFYDNGKILAAVNTPAYEYGITTADMKRYFTYTADISDVPEDRIAAHMSEHVDTSLPLIILAVLLLAFEIALSAGMSVTPLRKPAA